MSRFFGAPAAILLCAALARAAGPALSVAEENPAALTLILANSADPGSLRVAQHYAAARGIPADNLIALPMPLTETVTWREFVATIWNPLEDELVRRQWIDAIGMALTDSAGRRKFAVHGHRIAYLAVCRGVPLRIDHDAALYSPKRLLPDRAEFSTNHGAVDSELALLPQPNYNINGFAPNPLHRNDRPSAADLAQVVRVSRLDGPTVEDALALVDHALAAERTGLLGRAYVDIGGALANGDEWFELTAKMLVSLGFDTDVDRAPATIPASARFDAPVLYFGWYSGTVDGPFALPGFRFPPGAIALHLHSYSASSLRNANGGWTAPFIARGVTATVGNVFEPYLQFTHHPLLLLRALARGGRWGDAVLNAIPTLSWQGVAVGDPLYRPFAVSADEQWAARAQLPPRLAGYAALRRMRVLELAENSAEALAVAETAMRDMPSLALGLARARLLERAGDAAAAGRSLTFAALLKDFRTDEWALGRDCALFLARCAQAARAEELWRNLFADPAIPRVLRAPWLRDAADAARAAGDPAQALRWQHELDELVAQVPGK